ncbi:MAG TPA: cytochrome P450 [Deltaproteobacteria bacterium]|jgi:cytochrome P450|nr:cytochrome P450 [Deltaproteobacteria bacterium]
MPDLYYDPYDYEIDAAPHPTWRRMRDEAPLYRNERYDFWALSRFQDVLDASIDHETYSSARGTVLEIIRSPQRAHLQSMIFMDPPEHDRLRGLVSRAFSPRRIAGLEPEVRKIVCHYLDAQVGSGGFDFVADFGAKVPMMVISSMLGIPEGDRDQIRQWMDQLLHREPGETHPEAHLTEIGAKTFSYFAGYVAERRKAPRDDMMTDLLQAELETSSGEKRRLTDKELLAFLMLLAGAGNETVARLLGFAGATFAEYPEQRANVVARSALIPNAIEELLRYEAPSPVQARTVMRDVHWYGTTVARDSVILLLTGSAGRDERQYPDPDRFDVERSNVRHLSFGYGTHFCLGAALARLEGRVALEEVFARFPEWEVDWDRVERVHTSTVRGYAKLPILF